MSLHDWDVDFAVWCTYKYLNSGPGGIGGLFVHEKWASKPTQYVLFIHTCSARHSPGLRDRFAGWWGHDPLTRFAMPPQFSAIPGAQGFQQSNPSVLATVALLGALELFRAAGGMQPLRTRSLRLTGHLERLLQQSAFWIAPDVAGEVERQQEARDVFGFTIITPADPAARGSQLSLVFFPAGGRTMPKVMDALAQRGVVGDSRKPDVIRLAPCALYNTFEDAERAVEVLEEVLTGLQKDMEETKI
jgi:kynureninase